MFRLDTVVSQVTAWTFWFDYLHIRQLESASLPCNRADMRALRTLNTVLLIDDSNLVNRSRDDEHAIRRR